MEVVEATLMWVAFRPGSQWLAQKDVGGLNWLEGGECLIVLPRLLRLLVVPGVHYPHIGVFRNLCVTCPVPELGAAGLYLSTFLFQSGRKCFRRIVIVSFDLFNGGDEVCHRHCLLLSHSACYAMSQVVPAEGVFDRLMRIFGNSNSARSVHYNSLILT